MHNPFRDGRENDPLTDLHQTELDELPDFAEVTNDEIKHLPIFDEQEDEFDELPDLVEVADLFSDEIEEMARYYRSVDVLYEECGIAYSAEGKIPLDKLPSVISLKDVVKDSAPIEMIKTVTYFSLLHVTMAVDYTTSILEHYSGFPVDESYYGEISDFYHEVITPEYLKQFYQEQLLTLEQIISGMTEITCEAIDAVAYLGAKALLGVADVVEDAVTFAVGTVADISGHLEFAEKLYKSDIVGDISDVLDESYDGLELIKKIGYCAENVGEVGTYIALTVLSASEAPIIAFASAAGIGIARAGEVTRESVEKTGQYTHKELLSGIISGVVSVASAKFIPALNEGIEQLAGPAMEKVAGKIGNEAARHVVALALGTTEAAFIGGVDAAVFESQDIFKDFVTEALDIDDDFEVGWNHFFKGVATGAAINGSVYLVSNVAKDINKNLDEKRAANLKDANENKQGGSYKDVKKNSNGETHEVHHMPSDSSSNLERNDGPAIKMEKADHRRTASCGSSREAREYQQIQRKLIEEGKFMEALQMDIDDIHEKFGDKYDDAIAEMLDYVQTLIAEGKING